MGENPFHPLVNNRDNYSPVVSREDAVNVALRTGTDSMEDTSRVLDTARGTIRLFETLGRMETAEFEKLVQPIALVVDDEPLILMDTADMMLEKGYAVVEASTADQAYAFLDKHSSLQLLFTDVQMPGDLDGFDLARVVAERWPHIRVIIASGAVVPGPGELPGNAKFISKPFTAELVHEVLREHGLQR